MVLSTLLTALTIYTHSALGSFIGTCNPNSNQCATSATLVSANPVLCNAAATCCGCTNIACADPCSGVKFDGEASAVGAKVVSFDGDDNGMPVVISGKQAGQRSSITGDAMTSFEVSGEMGFGLGTLIAHCNEDTKCTLACTGKSSCDGASISVTQDAQSFTVSGQDGFLSGTAVFTLTSNANGGFTVNCNAAAGGACEGADITIQIEDCLGDDPWPIGNIVCAGDDGCNGASFTFKNDDPDCTMQVASFDCGAGTNVCTDLRVKTIGNVAFTSCTCSGGACVGAGLDPPATGTCANVFPNTFSPTKAPVPTKGPTPCPTTTAPTTAAPVTAAPVTSAPVTAAPVTAAPITSAPVTAAPNTAAPVTAAPITSAPVTAAPSTTSSSVTKDDSDSDSDSSDDMAQLEEVLDELDAMNAAKIAPANEENETEENGLFGEEGIESDKDEVTNYEMVISLSYEALEHLWAIVITFVVFNGICIWCYYNRFGRNKRYGDSLPSV